MTKWQTILLRRSDAFTLAELLIALSILGVIATFTIPKVLQGGQSDQRRSVMRECVASVHSAMMGGFQSGQMDEANMMTYLFDHLNYTKKCSGNSESLGCWTAGYSNGQTTSPGFIMHNGCSVAGLDNTVTGGYEYLVFDWNGSAPPNVEGQDQMELKFSLPPNGSNGRTPGSMWGNTATSDVMYREIFSN